MTADCATYVAPHRAQLGADGGKYGGVNCTPCGGGRALDQGTCGHEKFTGAEIRAASSEPRPDPKSPGLNLEQVDAAVFRLTHGRVNFDSRRMYSAYETIRRVLGGEPAIVQFQRSALVAMGLGFGHGFKGGHASSLDGINGLHLDDPLTKRFPMTETQVVTLLGSLLIEGRPIGRGNAYVSFAPDSTADWHVSIPKPPRDGKPHAFGLYVVNPTTRKVVGAPKRRYTRGFSANCTSARRFDWSGHSSQSLVILTSGSLAKEAAKKGQTYAVRATWATEGRV